MSGDQSTGGSRLFWTIGVCLLIASLEGYDIQAFGVAAPHLAKALRLGPAAVGWAGSASALGLVIGAVAGGWAADRWGRKPVLLASVLIFGAFSVATAVSQTFEALTAFRLAAGVGFGGVMPNLIAMAAEVAPPGRRAAVTSAMFCGMPLGGAAVSLLAGSMGGALDWRALFMVGGVLPLLISPLIAWVLRETRPAAKDAGRVALADALFGEGRWAMTLLLWAANFLALVVMYLLLNWLPTLVAAMGHTAADGAHASLAFNLSAVAGALLLGVSADRLGARNPLTVAFLALGAALAVLAASAGLSTILMASGAAGFLVIGSQYVLYGMAPGLYPVRVRSAAAGAAVAAGRIGAILAPLLAGELRQAGWTAGQVLAANVPVALAAGLAVVMLMRRPSSQTETA